MSQEQHLWLAAARDPAVALELEAIYQMIADQIEARGPACWASGRCCNFERTGHRLYVTGLEAAYTIARLEKPVSAAEVAAARTRGDCPFLSLNLCSVHTIKPLGCRVYFCDRSAQEWQQDLSEKALDQVKRLHERRNLPYRYGEWRAMLELLLT
jgi:Fe-S-cluster containining protein